MTYNVFSGTLNLTLLYTLLYSIGFTTVRLPILLHQFLCVDTQADKQTHTGRRS